ncbi:hypothetical protein QP185_22415 [Sphingomonas aerolata]|uniref:hypothetical protein n=1 Tax=Sphingomonas aerolata TaxID=185951 RepID=UPI002FE10A7B
MIDHAPVELAITPSPSRLSTPKPRFGEVAMPLERRALQRIVRTASYHERTWHLCLRRLAKQTGRSPTVSAATFGMVPSLKLDGCAWADRSSFKGSWHGKFHAATATTHRRLSSDAYYASHKSRR